MAGDWIKIEANTCSKPEIAAIAAYLGIHPDEAMGKCVRFWAWVDAQSNDGILTVKPIFVDTHLIGCAGFCQALVEVSWLKVSKNGLEIPNFHRYFGLCGKIRKANNERKKRSRQGNVTRDITVTSQKSHAPPLLFSVLDEKGDVGKEKGFEAFWEAYPRKVWHDESRKAWSEIDGLTLELSKRIFEALEIQKRSDQWKRGVIPNPSTWIRGCGWDNEVSFNGNVEPIKPREQREAETIARREADARAAAEAKKSREGMPKLKDTLKNG